MRMWSLSTFFRLELTSFISLAQGSSGFFDRPLFMSWGRTPLILQVSGS